MANALQQETSPYLIQHADNPVDWRPWSEDAFELARQENKLVFLSIGYSTCHWCHVMAHESFESESIAELLNHHFVCVKVDREERPDIDAAFMQFVQMTTGQGGWPMSVWLTPDGEPVFGGTYFPPEDRHGRPGLPRIIHELGRVWRDDRENMQQRASGMMEQLRQSSPPPTTSNDLPPTDALALFIDRCQSLFDPQLGGFGGAPKFPRPVVLHTLMQLADRFGTDTDNGRQALDMVTATLHAMADGGMHDHLAGGFHRYSVDRYWHVPHYEKMLYDQAQLATAYLSGWQLTGDPKFKAVAEGIFHYLLTDMLDDGGAYHAAEDADSLPDADSHHTREGAYWTWTADEISELLQPRDASIFCAAFGVEVDGNARPESDPHHELTGQNTLFRAQGDDQLAALFDSSIEDISVSIQESSETLMQARGKRPLPHRDDKILTAWNGLAIAALAHGGRLLDRKDLTEAATQAARFIEAKLWDGTALYRSFRNHRGTTPGFPADYAFLIHGLIELHAATLDDHWLIWAKQVQERFDEHCWSDEHSGYLMQPTLAGKRIMPVRDDHDGAEPSPNHLAIDNLLRLAALTETSAYTERATSLLKAGTELITKHPFSAPLLLSGLDLIGRGVTKIELPESLNEAERNALKEFRPLAVITSSSTDRATICEGQACKPLA